MAFKFNPLTGKFDIVEGSSAAADITLSAGYVATSGTVAALDTVEEAIAKLDGRSENIDGGAAATVYLATQVLDGMGA